MDNKKKGAIFLKILECGCKEALEQSIKDYNVDGELSRVESLGLIVYLFCKVVMCKELTADMSAKQEQTALKILNKNCEVGEDIPKLQKRIFKDNVSFFAKKIGLNKEEIDELFE